MEKALSWYNGLEKSVRNNIILTIYDLVGNTKENIKYKTIDCTNNGTNDGDVLNEIKTLNKKITNIVCMSQLSTIDLLEFNYPKNTIKKEQQTENIYLEINNVKCMINDKFQTDNNIQNDPMGTIEEFEKSFKRHIDDGKVDFGIFVAPKTNVIPTKGTINIEFISTSKGNKLICYVANTFNHQERLISVIEAGVNVVKNIFNVEGNFEGQNEINEVNVVTSINSLLNDISVYSYNLKEKHRIIEMSSNQYENDKLFIDDLNNKLKHITTSTNDKQLENIILEIAYGLYTKNKIIMKKELIVECAKKGISKYNIDQIGNMKLIKSKLYKLVQQKESSN